MFRRILLFQNRSLAISKESSWLSTLVNNTRSRKTRLKKYENEHRRQVDARTLSIEKAIVTISASNNSYDNRQLLMNDHCSTYYDCIRHISKHMAERTALVELENAGSEQFLSVHSVINGNSKIRCLNFNDVKENLAEVNKAYWRSCAFILGAIAESSFCNEVILKSIHPSDYGSGRFGYSVLIKGLNDWKASKAELELLTRACFEQYIDANLLFEPLAVSRDVAREIFEDNPYKQEAISNSDTDTVTIYKLGDYVDIVDGPLIGNTNQIGRYAITKVKAMSDLYGFYGVSIPAIQKCSSFSWDLIVASSKSI